MTKSEGTQKKTGRKTSRVNARRLRRLRDWIRAQPGPVAKTEIRRRVRVRSAADTFDLLNRLIDVLKARGDIFSPARGVYQAAREPGDRKR